MRRAQRRKQVIGLTGSFGSGKSTVAAMFKSFGGRIIDADAIAHRLLSSDRRTYTRIVATFGDRILTADKRIDRAALARRVFASPKLLKALNGILHPQVITIIKKQIRGAAQGVIIIDAPLLFETGIDRLTDAVVVVTIGRSEQFRRLEERGFSASAIKARIRRQMPLRQKVRRADFLIDNSGTKNETRAQARAVWRQLAASSGA